MERRQLHIAGSLLVIGTAWTIAAIRIAEVLTPGYSIRGEAISGLGSTYFGTFACMAAHCNTIYQPASLIFVVSEIATATLLLLSARYLSYVPARKSAARLIALMGVGTLVLASSYIPLYAGTATANFTVAVVFHIAASLLVVALGALLAVRADAFAGPWLKFISRSMGAIIFVTIPVYAFMFTTDSLRGPGFGGVERIGFYAIFAWFLLYGAYLLTTAETR